MSSIDPKGVSPVDRELLRRFYFERLVPAADSLKRRGAVFFPLGPDSAASWYENAPEYPELTEIESDSFGLDLKEIWEKKGFAELADLALAIGDLAKELEIAEDQSEDVSPFVYVMF
jgi:hypothetical protein